MKDHHQNTFKQGKALLSLSEALAVIEGNIKRSEDLCESILSEKSLGRRLAKSVYAHEDLPKFRKATMDGYAIIDQIKEGITVYELAGQSQMGQSTEIDLDLQEGQAFYVPTGSRLPEKATAVVKVEGCQVDQERIQIIKSEEAGPHWILKGEDVSAGDLALEAGALIGPMSLGFLSLMGVERIEVERQLKLAVITTGDELVPSFDEAPAGKIRDINQAVIKALAAQNECQVIYANLLKDDPEEIEKAILEGIAAADLVITCGASSMGKMDVMPEILDRLSDGGLLFHGLNIKPGKPVGLVTISGKPLLALPGNPVSSAMTFVVVAEKVIGQLRGRAAARHTIKGVLQGACQSQEGKKTFIPVRVQSQNGVSHIVPNIGKSGLISIIATADGFIALEPNEVAKVGETVEVTLF